MFSTLLALTSLLVTVNAHGQPWYMKVDGVTYAANLANQPQHPSPIRLISDFGPVKGTDNPDLSCGFGGAPPAALTVPATAGSDVTIQYLGGIGGPWVHDTGPINSYLAECDGPCESYDHKNAKWFKINEAGLSSDNSGKWVQASIKTGSAISMTIPANIKSGNYLLRTEIMALHLAMTPGGAEFYPSCAQLKISGSGSATPATTVSFPGAYKADDAGILVPDIYNPGFKYTFPGPALDPMAGSDTGKLVTPLTAADVTSSPAGASAPAASASSTSPTVANPAATPSSPATCGLKKKQQPIAAGVAKHRKRREMSRVMHKLLREIQDIEAALSDY